jgi:peptidoglycan/LPS O-acetylase OafA/YrhL
MTNTGYHGSFLAYWPTFFLPRGDLSGYYGTFSPAHLWFILYLLVISAVSVPIMVRLRGTERCRSIASTLARPLTWIAVVPGLAVVSLLPAPGGKNPFFYLAYFLAGFVAMSDERFMETIERLRGVVLALGLAALAVMLATAIPAETAVRFSLLDVGHSLSRFNAGWFLVLACLGYGKRYLDRPHAFLSYAGEASYPFYILHQTVIVLVAFLVVKLPWGIAPKFALIAGLALLLTTGGYEVVRRVKPLRVLFGLKPAPAVRAGGEVERRTA